MANIKPNELKITKNKQDDDTIDIIKQLIDFVSYLKMSEDCQMLLKPSKVDLKNEIRFQNRAEKILKYHQQQDQIKIEEKMVSELQQCINAINYDLDNEINKEKLGPKSIAKICDKMLILKMLNIKNSKNIKSLEDFLQLNKFSLKDITKMEKEIKVTLDKLSPKEKSTKKSENKVSGTLSTSRDQRSSMSHSNAYRRNDRNGNVRVNPRANMERVRQFGSITNDDIVIEPQTYTNEVIRLRLENDYTRVMENFNNRSNIDQPTRNNEDLVSHDFMMGSVDEDLVEFSSLNSTVNLCKDNEDNNSGDIHLILQPTILRH